MELVLKRQKAVMLPGGSVRGGGREQARLVTCGQSVCESWKVMHNAEEQCGSERWVSGAYIQEVTGMVSWAWLQWSRAGSMWLAEGWVSDQWLCSGYNGETGCVQTTNCEILLTAECLSWKACTVLLNYLKLVHAVGPDDHVCHRLESADMHSRLRAAWK